MANYFNCKNNERKEIMLIQLQKLNIINEGFGKTNITLNKIYLNPTHIISVVDYNGAQEFLLREGNQEYKGKSFSLLRFATASKVEEMIVLGKSEQIYSKINPAGKKDLLNG